MPKSAVLTLPPELAKLRVIEQLVSSRTARLREWERGLISLHSLDLDQHVLIPWPMRQEPGKHYREVYAYVHKSKVKDGPGGLPQLGDGSRRDTLDILATSHAITLSYPMIVGLDQGNIQTPESVVIRPGTRAWNDMVKDLLESRRVESERSALIAAGRVDGYRAPKVKRRGKIF